MPFPSCPRDRVGPRARVSAGAPGPGPPPPRENCPSGSGPRCPWGLVQEPPGLKGPACLSDFLCHVDAWKPKGRSWGLEGGRKKEQTNQAENTFPEGSARGWELTPSEGAFEGLA